MADPAEQEPREVPPAEAEGLLKWSDVRAGDRIILKALSASLESSGEVRLLVMENQPSGGYKPDVTLRLEGSGVYFNNSGRQPIALPKGTVLRAGPSAATHGSREGRGYFGGIRRGAGLHLEDVLEPSGLLSKKVVLNAVGRIRIQRGAGDPDALADATDEYRLRIEAYDERLRGGR